MNHRIFVRVLVTSFAVACWLLGFGGVNPAAAQRGDRELILIVPGSPGEHEDWAHIEPVQATFASELARTAGDQAEVTPFFWHGSDDHPGREAAARELAHLIDDRAPRFDRVAIVGHSFGGDIALRAAGLSHEPIDLIITLSTPHVYVEVHGEGDPVYLPVFCDFHAREKTHKIINIFPSREDLPSGWADTFFFSGLSRRDALPLTDSWREHLDYDRLHDPASAPRVIQSGEVLIARYLNVANANLKVQSLVTPWEAQHASIHSRRLGAVLGDFIREGATAKAQEYIDTMVEPADSDRGEAVPEEEQRQFNHDHAAEFDDFGWRLDEVSVDVAPLDRRTAEAIHDISVHLEIGQGREPGRIEQSDPVNGTTHVELTPDWLMRDRQGGEISVFLGDKKIADAPIHPDQPPPDAVRTDPLFALDVKSDFKWTPVHH